MASAFAEGADDSSDILLKSLSMLPVLPVLIPNRRVDDDEETEPQYWPAPLLAGVSVVAVVVVVVVVVLNAWTCTTTNTKTTSICGIVKMVARSLCTCKLSS